MDFITEQTAGHVVPSGRTGRTRYTAEYKRKILAAFAASCLSAPQFARQCGIKYPTLASWLATGKASAPPPAGQTPTFLLAELSAAP